VRRRVLGELFEKRLKLGIRSRVGDSGAQADARLKSNIGIVGELEGEIDVGVGDSETRGHDAHDGVIFVNELEVAADHRGIRIEVALPKAITEDHHGLRILAIGSVGRNQGAAEERGYAEMRAGVRGELNGGDVLREVLIGGGEVPSAPTRGDTFDAFGFAEGFELRAVDADPTSVAALVDYVEFDHAVGAEIGVGIDE
jgi:hypothetical protein